MGPHDARAQKEPYGARPTTSAYCDLAHGTRKQRGPSIFWSQNASLLSMPVSYRATSIRAPSQQEQDVTKDAARVSRHVKSPTCALAPSRWRGNERKND
eukprot:scaffold207879_cov35-Tisochrysis_lutea.AAC.4